MKRFNKIFILFLGLILGFVNFGYASVTVSGNTETRVEIDGNTKTTTIITTEETDTQTIITTRVIVETTSLQPVTEYISVPVEKTITVTEPTTITETKYEIIQGSTIRVPVQETIAVTKVQEVVKEGSIDITHKRSGHYRYSNESHTLAYHSGSNGSCQYCGKSAISGYSTPTSVSSAYSKYKNSSFYKTDENKAKDYAKTKIYETYPELNITEIKIGEPVPSYYSGREAGCVSNKKNFPSFRVSFIVPVTYTYTDTEEVTEYQTVTSYKEIVTDDEIRETTVTYTIEKDVEQTIIEYELREVTTWEEVTTRTETTNTEIIEKHVCDFEKDEETPDNTSITVHETSDMEPNRCPVLPTSKVENLLDKLYYIGERLTLIADSCSTTETTYTPTMLRRCKLPNCPYGLNDWVVYEESVGTTSDPIYHDLTVNISGIVLLDSNGNELPSTINNITGSSNAWRSGDIYVKEWKNTHYSEILGTSYGKITITCNCGSGCSKTFYIPGPRPALTNDELKVHINPEYGGEVTVTYQQADGTGRAVTKTETLTGDGGTIYAVEEGTVKISVKSNLGYTYTGSEGYVKRVDENGRVTIVKADLVDGRTYNYDETGELIYGSLDGIIEYNYQMIKDNSEVWVNFDKKDAESKYTLYITSTIGGKAWIEECHSSLQDKIERDEDSFGIYKETVRNVDEGLPFIIKYEVLDGYYFKGWEYRPHVNATEEGETTKIFMPTSDLTVTAVFGKIEEPVEPPKKPTLRVTTNNEAWGTAYILLNGARKNITELEPGEYTVYYESNNDYYFINWEYSSSISPFKPIENLPGQAVIIMPNHDLEIKAFFAPKPGPVESGYSVDFRPEPPEGGDVPEDIEDVNYNSKVTIAVTPHEGYKFDRWGFFKEDGTEVDLKDKCVYDEDGTGYFIMPDYNVEAVAYFTKLCTIRVKIIGEGEVYYEEIKVPDGKTFYEAIGSQMPFISVPEEGWRFKHWINSDGVILSEEEIYIHQVTGDITLIAVFENEGPYTLYVSSLYGGTAEITEILVSREGHTLKDIIPSTDALGKTVYKLENVYAGDRFKISYEVDDNYVFDMWEYRPYIEADLEEGNNIEITMPASNLTVTAMFNKDDIMLKPRLSVTTNNAAWGTAYTKINGKPTVSDIRYDTVVVGEEYTLYYEAKPGYYFVNWKYSIKDTPFIRDDVIKMPNMDLEVMAMFAPIPPQGEKGHSITFLAEPAEGGKVPDDLENILPGGEVTIAVTCNRGYEFLHWRFENENGEIVSPSPNYNLTTGTGSFIMPDYNIKAIAVFKEKEWYTLYVTHYYGGDAWTFDNDGNVSRKVEKAYVGDIYDLVKTEDDNYEFDRWEFRWSGYGQPIEQDGINPMLYASMDKALMPRSDMTVTAVFKEKVPTKSPLVRVSSNNLDWGDAWIEIDGYPYCWSELVESDNQWLPVEAGKEYRIGYKAETNCEFTNWIVNNDKYGQLVKIIKDEDDKDTCYATFKMPNEKIEIMAFFKPGPEEEKTYTLKVETDPEKLSGKATIGRSETEVSGIKVFTDMTVYASEVSGYEFKYWYTLDDFGNKIVRSTKEIYEFEMPAKDITLIAKYKKDDDNTGIVTVEANPEEGGDVVISNTGRLYSTFEIGEDCTVVATPNDDWKFIGWYNEKEDGRRIFMSNSKTFTFNVLYERYDLVADFEYEGTSGTTPPDEEYDRILKDFRIVSVRDLNWKDYFTTSNGILTGHYFGIPMENTTMLQNATYNREDYTQPIKMGYAVEFELTTTGIALEGNTKLVITPKVYGAKDGEIETENLINSTTELKGDFVNRSDYARIEINKHSSGKGSFMEYAKAIPGNITVNNIPIPENEILWRWVYYLPADTYIPGAKSKDLNEIVVDFDVELFDSEDHKAKDIVVNARNVFNSNWNGYVYRYSLEESLLDDIYDNAQN